uniref:Major facilitator superfamily (MFS) profile domain-containing protein n=1 Tax=Panagrolaimus superbus TaxID=310955 RepID=A0A914YQF6_9BILA
MDDSKISLIRGIYNSIYYAGQILGAVLGPHFPDKYGRKIAYIGTTIFMTTSCAIQMAATLTNYPEILIFGRFIGALFAPMNDAVMLLYCQETTTPKMRGVLSSLFTTGYSVMALIGMILGMKNILGNHLTILLAVPIPLGIIGCIYLFFLQETPKFLMITKRDRNAALKSLTFYQGEKSENEEILDNYLSEANEQSDTPSLLDLVKIPHLRKSVIIGNASLMLVLPFFSILLSSTYFMEKVGIDDQNAQFASTLCAVVLIIACFVATYLLKTFGRRTLLLIFGIFGILFLSVFAAAGKFISLKYISMAGLFGYIICFGLSLGPISFSIASELVPLQYRSSIICIVFSLNSIFVVVTNVAVEPLFEAIGSIAFIPLFIAPCIISLIYLYFSLPETKDCETYEIVQMLKGGKTRVINDKINTNF